jgi:mono/diheme cytochrome c family protein
LNKAFDGTFVPGGWIDPANANVKAAYSGAFAISCRSCHAARVAAGLAFPTFADLNKKKNDVNDLVYALPKDVQPMPNALRTFTIFWGSEGANVKGLNAKPPPDQTDLLQSVLGLAGPRPAP